METIRKTLRDSKAARWTALAVVAFTMLCGYYLTDVMAPLKGLLEGQLGWNSSEFGFFTSAYGWFNVFLLMLIVGGIILDKMGVRFTGLMAASIMVIGTFIKYYAISTHSLDGHYWHILFWNIKAQVFLAGFGFAVFGVGVEVAGITVSKIIVKWFKGKEMALAMGLEMATARLGTALALSTSVPIAKGFNNVSAPILVCLIMLCIGLISFFIYTFMDKKLDASQAEYDKAENIVDTEEAFRVRDILKIVTNKGWWYLAILCVLFYSAVFPFLKYATDLMVQKFHINEDWAGIIPAMLPFGTILLTPLFGNLYDRKGKGASIMVLGAILLIFVHIVFTIPFLNHWIIAILLILVLGIGFSLVPSAMWPSVPKIIPEKQLGTAYSLVFWVQNWGLMGVPALIGWVLNKYCFIGYFAVAGTGFVTTQGSQISQIVTNDHKSYVIDAVGLISRKNVDQKIAQLVKDTDGRITAVISSGNDTVNTEFITKKSLKKAIKNDEFKVVQYYYEEPARIEKIAQVVKNAEGKITSIITNVNDTITASSLTAKELKRAIKKGELEVVKNSDPVKNRIANFVTGDGTKIPKYTNVFSFYNYTRPMMIFTGLGILALLFAFLLKGEDKKKGYGLQMPNIKQ
jgi:MFS family permease